ERHVERHRDGGDQEREPDRGERVGLGDGGEIDLEALSQRGREHGREWHDEEQAEEGERDAGEQPADRGALGGGGCLEGRGGHGQAPTASPRRARCCRPLTSRRSRNDATSITTAM